MTYIHGNIMEEAAAAAKAVIEKIGSGMMEHQQEEKVKFPAHCRLITDAREAEDAGWREALISSGDHLKRVLDEYGDLDFDCLLERLDISAIEGCTDCFQPGERIYRVYVRPRPPTG
jgi:hypothetical protein